MHDNVNKIVLKTMFDKQRQMGKVRLFRLRNVQLKCPSFPCEENSKKTTYHELPLAVPQRGRVVPVRVYRVKYLWIVREKLAVKE